MRATPEQLHEMFSYCMDFARTMLEKAGDFYPFGATLAPDGVVATVGGDNGEEKPNPLEIYKLLSDAFGTGALDGQFLGVALAANVNIPAQYSPTAPDGLRVQLETFGYARYVYVPYQVKQEGIFKKKNVVVFDEPFSVEIPANFFVSTS